MVSVHTSSPPTVHAAYLRCLLDGSKCDSSGFDLNSRNSSWSIACLKEYLRKKRGLTVVCCSRKPSFLNAKHLSLNRHLAYTLRCVYTPMFFQVQPETKKKKKKKKKKRKASWNKLRLHCNLFPLLSASFR